MRILIASTTYHPALNGQAIFTTNLARGLAGRGHEVRVVYPFDKTQPGSDDSVQLQAVESFNLGAVHGDSFVTLFPHRAVREAFDDFHPEIVHIQDHYPLTRAVVLEAQKRGVRRVGTNHFMPENLAPYIPFVSRIKPVYNWILWHWMLETYNRLDVATAQSRVAAGLIRARGLRIPVLPASCGIDLKRFHPDPNIDRLACRQRYGIDPHCITFLFVGRVDREKRVDVLLHALQKLNRNDVQLVVAGKGTISHELQALAKSLGLGNCVRFTGFIPHEDLHVLLNSVDIFSMPSEAELLSIASLEAMACGRPVLLADAIALPDLVTPGLNGYLFKAGDAAEAAHYMNLLADQRDRWEAMGRASLEKARYHSLDNTIHRYEKLYQRTVAGEPLTDF